jgi:hypothetical protein
LREHPARAHEVFATFTIAAAVAAAEAKAAKAAAAMVTSGSPVATFMFAAMFRMSMH